MPHNTYKFKTIKERLLTSTSAVAGLSVLGIGLASVFNPIALGAVGAYSAYKYGSSALMAIPPYKRWAMNRMVKKGHAKALPEDAPVSLMAKDISDSLGRPKAPKVYTIDVSTVAEIALPLGMRWLAKLRPVQDSISREAMRKVFAAAPGANVLLTTKEALATTPEKEMRFIIAHEMSHLKTDAFSPSIFARSIIKHTTQPLILAAGVATGLSLFGVGLPLTLGLSAIKALGAVIAIQYAAKATAHFGMRVVERRADRNALYITRDMDGAQKAMDHLHDGKQRKAMSIFKEAVQTHPSYLPRKAALLKSFNAVSKYPPLQPVNDNTAEQKPEKAKVAEQKVS